MRHGKYGHQRLTARSLRIQDHDGNEVISATANPFGGGVLTIKNNDGKRLIFAGAGESGNGAFVELYNKTGEGII